MRTQGKRARGKQNKSKGRQGSGWGGGVGEVNGEWE